MVKENKIEIPSLPTRCLWDKAPPLPPALEQKESIREGTTHLCICHQRIVNEKLQLELRIPDLPAICLLIVATVFPRTTKELRQQKEKRVPLRVLPENSRGYTASRIVLAQHD